MTVRTAILLATAALVAMPCALAQDKGAAGAKKLFCWQEKGQRVCSDALPAGSPSTSTVPERTCCAPTIPACWISWRPPHACAASTSA